MIREQMVVQFLSRFPVNLQLLQQQLQVPLGKETILMANLLTMDLEESLLIQMGILLQFLHLIMMAMEMTQVMQEFILGMDLLGLKEGLILMVR